MFADRRANSRGTRRHQQPWPVDWPFRILALDGGGIKGIYTAELMRLREEHFGRPVASVFDMIAGTSTDGIITLGLGLGKSAAEIAAFSLSRDKVMSGLVAWAIAACLNLHWFDTIAQAHGLIESWRIDYNESRPHMALGNIPPSEYALRASSLGHAESKTAGENQPSIWTTKAKRFRTSRL